MKKTTKTTLITHYILALISVLGFVVTSAAQCPTVIKPVQTFCDVETPTIANLAATNKGQGVRWYATPTSTVALSNTTGLVNDGTYYADNSTGSCGARQRVDVTIYGPPIALNFQGVCVDDPQEATISDLFATGNDIKWYDVANGGSAIPPAKIAYIVKRIDDFYYLIIKYSRKRNVFRRLYWYFIV